MQLAIALSTLLALIPSPRAHASPPAVTEPEAGAWAVVHAGQLWVCWERAPQCWRRVSLDEDAPRDHAFDEAEATSEDFLDPGAPLRAASPSWRLGFSGPRTLWIEAEGRRWRVDRGQRSARSTTEAAPVSLARPRVHTCAAQGSMPTWIGGRLGWQAAPTCRPGPTRDAREHGCVPSRRTERVRRPSPLRIRAGLQIAASRGWASFDDRPRALAIAGVGARANVEVSVFVELGLDLASARRDERARATLMRQGAPQGRALPSASGPLASLERRALATVLCGEVLP